MNRIQKTIIVFLVAIAAFLSSVDAKAGCGAGDKAQVLWKGSYYPATVIKGNGSQCYIHYDGYGSDWDEWVGPGRIQLAGGGSGAAAGHRFSEGDAVQVLWKGTWYDAHVLNTVGTSSYKIHYDGYGTEWDETVGPGRIQSN